MLLAGRCALLHSYAIILSMIFESHSHYDDPAFDDDREVLISSLKEHNIGKVIAVGSAFKDIPRILDMCAKYDFLYPALGVHPENALELNDDTKRKLETFIESSSPVAIGEIGLDYHYDEPSKDVQREAFIYQLKLADKYNLPVIVHSRDASEETFEILSKMSPKKKGVIHCFSSSKEMALEYVKMGYMIGIGGVVTFKNGRKLKEVATAVPLGSILIETDCPYMAPVPHRGERNSSLYLPFVIEEIASLRGITAAEVEKATYDNACRLFDIKD